MLPCRKHIEEQEREELLARRSNINWQGQVPHPAPLPLPLKADIPAVVDLQHTMT